MSTTAGAAETAREAYRPLWHPRIHADVYSLRRRVGRNVSALIGAGIIVIVVLAAIFAPVLTPYGPLDQNLIMRLTPPGWHPDGTWEYPLGTDTLGRDVLTRLLYGGRVSLLIGLLAVVVGGLIGITAGMLAGYYENSFLGVLFGRLADIQQSIPFIILVLAVAASVGPSLRNLVLILGIGSWLFYYRIVRGEVLAIREQLFIDAARAAGNTDRRIFARHVLPNVLPSILVIVTLFVPLLIIFSASLSFLGLGVQPPTPEWGLMIGEGRLYVQQAWWLSVMPGIVLALTVLAINMVGDWLRDRLDPMQRTKL